MYVRRNMESLKEQFEAPFSDKNITGHIWRFDKNISLETAMQTAISKPFCGAFVYTVDSRVFYKTITSEEAIIRLKDDVKKTEGHTVYVKKI